jgi:hypothetical protein
MLDPIGVSETSKDDREHRETPIRRHFRDEGAAREEEEPKRAIVLCESPMPVPLQTH